METFSAQLAICAGNSPVPGEFPAQRPVTLSFGVFFDLRINDWVNNCEAGDLRRYRAHYDVVVMCQVIPEEFVVYKLCLAACSLLQPIKENNISHPSTNNIYIFATFIIIGSHYMNSSIMHYRSLVSPWFFIVVTFGDNVTIQRPGKSPCTDSWYSSLTISESEPRGHTGVVIFKQIILLTLLVWLYYTIVAVVWYKNTINIIGM